MFVLCKAVAHKDSFVSSERNIKVRQYKIELTTTNSHAAAFAMWNEIM